MEVRDLAWTAYDNLDNFFKWRNIQRETPKINKDEFSVNMRTMGYIMVEGTAAARERLPQRNAVIIIFSPNSVAAKKKGNFTNLLSQMRTSGSKQKNYLHNTDVTFISSDKPVSTISGYDEIVTNLKINYKGVYLETYTYEKLIITPENSIIPSHRILSQEEVNMLNNDRLTSNSRRTPIPVYDPPVVWLGGRPGDVIEIRRPSGSTGYSVTYRVVK